MEWNNEGTGRTLTLMLTALLAIHDVDDCAALKQRRRSRMRPPTCRLIAYLGLPTIFADPFLFPAQDYFTELNKDTKEGRIGTIRRVELMYGPPPASNPLGKVEVSFQQADAAYKAVERLKNLKIDNKPIHVSFSLPLFYFYFLALTLTPSSAPCDRHRRRRPRAPLAKRAHHQRSSIGCFDQGWCQERQERRSCS